MPEILEVSAAQTFALRAAVLRAAVLRAGIPIEQVDFGDADAPQSRHFGAMEAEEIIGAGYISPIAEPEDAPDGWQLRGMSVADGWRGRGIGRAVLLRCIAAAREQGAPVLWCNARVKAVELYRREGFVGVGEVFEIAGIGPHLRMRLVLGAR